MPGRRERLELLIENSIERLPEEMTYPLLIVADHLGLELPELVLYSFASVGLLTFAAPLVLQRVKSTRQSD
jgi:hypothetical protein